MKFINRFFSNQFVELEPISKCPTCMTEFEGLKCTNKDCGNEADIKEFYRITNLQTGDITDILKPLGDIEKVLGSTGWVKVAEKK